MTGRRRSVEVFTLSFLDCICCGFGAVILFYTIISAQAGAPLVRSTLDLHAELDRLEEQVSSGRRGLVVLHNELQKSASESASDAAQTRSLDAKLQQQREHSSDAPRISLARREHIRQLKADIRALEEGKRRLEAGSLDRTPPGQQLDAFRETGGDRHYVTGIRPHGRRILILLDVSASMLHEDLVTILRLRNESDEQKRAAAKWRRALDTVDWLMTQMPAAGDYQIYTFNTRARALLADTAGRWLQAADVRVLERARAALRTAVPAEGTSLFNAFAAAQDLQPRPDQIILITDGLPTQGRMPGNLKSVDSAARVRLFDAALEQLPARVPVDSILLPMQGDLQAAHRFWKLARATNGTVLMPAKDWP